MKSNKKYPTLRWPGCKASLAPEILKYIPKRGRKFIDLFAGRGNLTFRAIAEGLEYEEWILNDTLTAPYLRAIRDHGDKFTASERHKPEFDRLAELAKHGDPHALLMQPILCFNGGTYDSGGYFSERRSQSVTSYEASVHLACKFIREKNVRITALDWWDCLEAEQLGPDDFVFIDYPYIGTKVRAYSPESICPTEVIEYLKAATFNWIFTEYDQPLYHEAFGKPFFQRELQLRNANVNKAGGTKFRMECIWTNIGKDWAKRDGVTVRLKPVPDDREDTYYVGLPLDELLREIRECAAVISASRNQMNKEMRKRLLLALKALKKLTFRKKPGFYATLLAMGFNPDTVRQWFYRSKTADEIIELLEEDTDQPNSGESGDETLQDARSLPLAQADKLPGAHDTANSVSVTPEFLPTPSAGDSADAMGTELARLRNDGRWHGFGSEWATDPQVYERLDREFHFTLDACASDLNFKHLNHFTEKENGLIQNWGTHTVFMNPPYGDALYEWMKKAYESSLLGARVVCLVPAATDTAWFHEFALKGEIHYLRGRQWFIDPEGERHQPYSPSIVVVFAPPCALKLLYAFDIQGPITPEVEAYIAYYKSTTIYDRLNDTSLNDTSQHDGGTVN